MASVRGRPDHGQPSAALPPAMVNAQENRVDEVLRLMNKTPLFMTELDETDEQGGENTALEAIKAIAYEGTPSEVADNFRNQGNEQARLKRWLDARQFYDKALAALNNPPKADDADEGPVEVDIVEVDEQAEHEKGKRIEEACHTNRALCNLELKNYRSCHSDCALALRINPMNIKAWYRAAAAFLALDKIPEAESACDAGLTAEPGNVSLTSLRKKIIDRKETLDRRMRDQKERDIRRKLESQTIQEALKIRNLSSRATKDPPDLEDAEVKLDKSLDPSSTLSYPILLLYPLREQSDFLKSFREENSFDDHLSYILPPPWDADRQYLPISVTCYMETKTRGLIQVGKKMSLSKILEAGKVELVDGLLKVYLVPQSESATWVEGYRQRKAGASP